MRAALSLCFFSADVREANPNEFGLAEYRPFYLHVSEAWSPLWWDFFFYPLRVLLLFRGYAFCSKDQLGLFPRLPIGGRFSPVSKVTHFLAHPSVFLEPSLYTNSLFSLFSSFCAGRTFLDAAPPLIPQLF